MKGRTINVRIQLSQYLLLLEKMRRRMRMLKSKVLRLLQTAQEKAAQASSKSLST